MVKLRVLLVLILLSVLHTGTHGVEPGKVTGGQKSTLPDWFKDSFLDIAEDVEVVRIVTR